MRKIADKKKRAMGNKMEKLLLRLIKAELVYSQARGIVEDIVDKMPEHGNADADHILRSCDEIAEVINQ